MVFDNQRILHGRTAFSSARHRAPSARLLPERATASTARRRCCAAGSSAAVHHDRHSRRSSPSMQARGAAAYFGERVSMTEHGLQAAHFAQAAGAPALADRRRAAARRRASARGGARTISPTGPRMPHHEESARAGSRADFRAAGLRARAPARSREALSAAPPMPLICARLSPASVRHAETARRPDVRGRGSAVRDRALS